MSKIIQGAKEATMVASGEIPAGRIWHNGHAYVPVAAVEKERATAHAAGLREAAGIAEQFEGWISKGGYGRFAIGANPAGSSRQAILDRVEELEKQS
jgi:hypothetical protein